jgi:LysM repeat protein
MFAKLLGLAALALIAWTVFAGPSGAGGDPVVYRVQPYDTLWTIASQHYGGDVREAIWRIQQANGLGDPTIRPGQRLVLP